MSTSQQQVGSRSSSVKQSMSPQGIFKYVNIAVFFILLFCIKGFLTFRQYCESKGYYVFSVDSLSWCGIGFFCIFVVKYSYFHFIKNRIEKIIHPKYEGEQREKKIKYVLKLSFDTCFYFFTTVTAYIFFQKQYWFPSIVGGCGQCSKIYKDYPNWPQDKRLELEIYFMIQLGVHAFSVFEMAVIKRKSERKFHQYLLHHVIAVSLILFSMMSNQILPGVMILIIHDMSDIPIAAARCFIDTKYQKSIISATLYVIVLISWILCRILVFPFCLLANVYVNSPLPTDEWYIISFEYKYLLTMAFVLFGMHLYWTFYLIKVGVASLTKKKITNLHEKNSD